MLLVRKRGFEPLRYYYRQPLKLVRLPVPPLPRGVCRTLSIFQRVRREQPSAPKLKQHSEESTADMRVAMANHIDHDLYECRYEKERKSHAHDRDGTHSATD